jgi:hypothetical protein
LREPLDAMIRADQIDEDLGKRLAAWATGTNAAAPQAHSPADPPAEPAADAATITADEALALEARCVDHNIPVAKLKSAAKVERLSMIAPTDLPRAHEWIDKVLAKRAEA